MLIDADGLVSESTAENKRSARVLVGAELVDFSVQPEGTATVKRSRPLCPLSETVAVWGVLVEVALGMGLVAAREMLLDELPPAPPPHPAIAPAASPIATVALGRIGRF
jgi:hypothetical protein